MRLAISLGLLLVASVVRAQVTVGDDLHMNLDSSLAVGYFASNGNLSQSAHSLSVGGEADLHGDYLDPRVINFVVSPYYNLSRANSSIQSIFDASGVNANTRASLDFPEPWTTKHEALISISTSIGATSSLRSPRCQLAMEPATAITRCSAPTPEGIAIPGSSACIAAISYSAST
jgi:hypothetical protein